MDTSLKKQLSSAGYKGDFDLGSLIEACGENFFSLTRWGDYIKDRGYKTYRWEACGKSGNERFRGQGDTPEEAVSELWLALNEK